MASTTYKFAPPSGNQQHQQSTGFDSMMSDNDDNLPKSSLSKTFGNVMNLVNDGLYRIKNRSKAELVAKRNMLYDSVNMTNYPEANFQIFCNSTQKKTKLFSRLFDDEIETSEFGDR